MFLLCGARPYVSIMCRWAICFYYVPLGHMFLLVGCGRAAGPYVSIGWLWAWGSAICFYWLAVGVALGHMFLLVGCARGARPYVSIVCRSAICFYCVCVCVGVCVCVCVTICFHRLAPSQGRNLLVLHK